MKKSVFSLLLVILILFSAVLSGCNGTEQTDTTKNEPDTTVQNGTETDTAAETETETEAVTEPETEEIIVDEDPVFYEKTDKDPVDPASASFENTDWDATIKNANALADGVQGRFTDAGRKRFLITNQNMSLLYDLSSAKNKLVAGLYNANGKAYFENTMDVTVTDGDGGVYSAAISTTNGRMNSHRLGYYYYDFRFTDQSFMSAESRMKIDENDDSYDIIANSGKWSGHDVTKIAKNDGVLSFTVSNPNDPYLGSTVNFSTSDYDAVQITIKSEYTTSGNFYIAAGSQTGFNAEQHVDFRFNSGDWDTVIVPISVVPDYTGNVTRFRVDCGSQTGEKIEIKELKAVKRGVLAVPFSLERVYHTYSDKMHETLRIVATSDYTGGGRFETTVAIPAETVRKLVIKNAAGEVSELDGFDFSTTEYVGFDIKGAGVYGIIMPAIENNGYINVELKDGNYIITRGIEIKAEVKKGGDLYFGQRIYTTSSHQFNDLRKEAYIERNPLTDVYIVTKTDGSKYAGYNALTGAYRFTINGSDFNKAYYREPDKHYKINAFVSGDNTVDRTIYIQTAEPVGQLESAALLDENNLMLPIPLEVGKNFMGEKEEPLYDPKDTAYGEVYVPLTIKKDENKKFTMLHLYQNWGKYPLKQLSFIAFHICYYHLSVGVTETNCIAPYFVYGKDAWTLPDFRANSAPLWSGQPQHTSAGRLYFLQYKSSDGNTYKSESQSADIISGGPVYADIKMEYLSDDGKIKAEYRHTEMPQTDENRTYYKIRLEVLDDVSINDFKNNFSFFTFDGRGVAYSKVGYLDENGEKVSEKTTRGDRIIKLGKEYPYYDYYGGNVTDSVNFALIVLRSDITVGGKKYDGNFVFHDKFDGSLNYGSLSLDLDDVTLKKGDVLELDIILLPWGYSSSKNDANVINVREDSCFDPYKLTVITGKAYEDCFIPSITAENNTASFKLSGGKNNCAVRVYGFTSYNTPEITIKAVGGETVTGVNGKQAYDGYQVYLDNDGTYSFSFVVDMDKASEYEITVKQ